MGGGGKAPKPDPKIGEAALKMAATGEDYLGWMQDQAGITNRWATEDRRRYQTEFRPLERTFIADAKKWASGAAMNRAATAARADVRSETQRANEASDRQLAAMGVNPNSGRFAGVRRALSIDSRLAAVGAGNLARDQRRREGMSLMGDAINLGKGMAVNPGTSMGLSNNALSSGAQAAMSGYQGMGNLLGQQDQQRMQAWQAGQQSKGDLFGALGTIGGMAAYSMPWATMFASSKKLKTNRRSVSGALKAVRETPVESWDYKPGAGDGGSHIGPMAEDWKKNTGLGDGKSISALDLHGVTLKAVQELDKKVDRLARKARSVAPPKRESAA